MPIPLYDGSPNQPLGNGARETLIDKFGLTAAETDNMLASLWVEGFKIVPLGKKDLH
jgi:hypothetical protein